MKPLPLFPLQNIPAICQLRVQVCAFAGGWVLVGAQALALPAWAGVLAAAAVATGLRALALATGAKLPAWSVGDAARD